MALAEWVLVEIPQNFTISGVPNIANVVAGIDAALGTAPITRYDSRLAVGGVPKFIIGAPGGGTATDFQIEIGVTNGSVEWMRADAISLGTNNRIQLFSDIGRTQIIYDSDFVDPLLAPSATLVEGTPFTTIAYDGSNLVDGIIYGTIINSNATPSDYRIQMVVRGL